MTMPHISAARLSAAVLLLVAVPADELAFRPDADLEVRKKLEVKVSIQPEKVEAKVNGDSVPTDDLGGLGDAGATIRLEVEARDKYVRTRDGHPTDLLRTFDSLRLAYEAGDEKSDADEFDALEGKTVRFRWNADSESYEKAFHEEKGDEALLEQLSEDMDVRLLLPAKKVSEGDTWEVAGDKLFPLFLPGGLPGEVATGEDKEPFRMALEEIRSSLSKFQEDLKLRCKYKGSRDEGGERVGEIEFTFTGQGKADISDLIQTIGAMEETDIHLEIEASADIDLQGGGTLLWHLGEGRIHAFTMRAEAGIDLDIQSKAEVEGEHLEILVKAHLATKSEWDLSTSRP